MEYAIIIANYSLVMFNLDKIRKTFLYYSVSITQGFKRHHKWYFEHLFTEPT